MGLHRRMHPQDMAAPRARRQQQARLALRGGIALALSGAVLALMAEYGARVGAQAPASPDAATSRTAAGRALYRQYCTACHGRDGRGASARKTRPEIPDFTRAAWHEHRRDSQLGVSILDGKGNGMPAFADKLNDDQVRNLITYVRTFGPVRAPEAQAPPGDFEAQFAALQEGLRQLQREFERQSGLLEKPSAARR